MTDGVDWGTWLLPEPRRKESEFTDAEKVAVAQANHIWLNAFSCVRPTDEFLIELGRMILDMVDRAEMVDDLIGRLPIAYVRINKS